MSMPCLCLPVAVRLVQVLAEAVLLAAKDPTWEGTYFSAPMHEACSLIASLDAMVNGESVGPANSKGGE